MKIELPGIIGIGLGVLLIVVVEITETLEKH